MVSAGTVSPISSDAGFQSQSSTGLDINSDVVFVITDMIGREVIVTTVDSRYTGILAAVNEKFHFGLRNAVKLTEDNLHHLMKTESELIEKIYFDFEDVVEVCYVSQEDKGHKMTSKFVTDRQYHGDLPTDADALEEWSGGEGEEGVGISIEDSESIAPQAAVQHGRRNNQNNGTGWSVDDMFAVNEKMNVISTFKDDLTQYTTVEVVGTDEDRARADKLAREIESNQSSKFYANLENDDVERDLDKTTKEDDFEYGGNQRRNKGNNSYNQQQQQRRNPNITPNGQPVNKRAEGLRSDRRNSGSSSANNSRYGPPSQTQNYQQQPKGNYNNRRQNEEYRDNDWQMAKGKGQNQGHDQSFRHQQKQMLDPRPSAKQPSNEGEKSQGSSSRVADLKNWQTGFDLANSPKEQSPAPGGTPATTQGNSAWNRGPPTSLVSKGSSAESTPPPHADSEEIGSSPARVEVAPSSELQKNEEVPSTSGEEHDEVDGKPTDGENSTVDTSDTSSNATSKSASFKFNINAPEFKPRVAPTTPTPTTPNGPMSQNVNPIPPQQFIPQEYQQQPMMVPQGGPPGAPMGMPPGMVSHMAPGIIPQSQAQPIMMWAPQPGQQAYAPNQQFPIQQLPMAGVPGQMYGTAANAPVTTHQPGNQQIPTSAAGGAPQEGRQGGPQRAREGEYREAQPCFYPYTPSGPVVPLPQQYYQPQYQPGVQQTPYQMKIVQQQAPGYQQRFSQPMYMGPPGMQQRFPQQAQQPQQTQQQQPPQQQQQYGGEQQGGPQSHPNSQPPTPGPRGEQNISGGKGSQGPPQAQNGNNNMGMHREPEGGSNASLSGSTSSQSGQRSGSPQNNVAPPPPQQQQQQGPPQGGPPPAQAQIMGMQQGHMNPYVQVMQHQQMHGQQHFYPQQPQAMFYPQQNIMMVQSQAMQPNHHAQPSMMGERSEQGYPNSNYFDYRNMPSFQPQQQHQQMHGGQMSRQNSLPQQFSGNQQILKV